MAAASGATGGRSGSSAVTGAALGTSGATGPIAGVLDTGELVTGESIAGEGGSVGLVNAGLGAGGKELAWF